MDGQQDRNVPLKTKTYFRNLKNITIVLKKVIYRRYMFYLENIYIIRLNTNL